MGGLLLCAVMLLGLASCSSADLATVHVGVGISPYGYGGYGGYGRGWGYSPGYWPSRPIGRPPIPTPYR
jgi:hypothetical protein